MVKNPKYTDQFKLEMINEFLSSDLSLLKFCEEKCINHNTFKIWYYEYKRQKEKWQAIEQESQEPAEIIMRAEKELTEEDKDAVFSSRIIVMKLMDASFSFDKSCLKEMIEAIRGYD